MSDRAPPIARIRLSRSLPLLLALPILALLAASATIAAGLVLVTGVAGLVLAAVGALVVLVALVGIVILLSVWLDVEEAAVRLGWLGGERIYPLSAGPVTRVRLRGENTSSLRGRRWNLGWQLGAAILRDEEAIEVVRLARTPTAIMVPTERGRLAIAAADEEALLNALLRAAHARKRLEDASPGTMEPPTAEPDSRRVRRGWAPRSWAPRPSPSLVLLILPLIGAGVPWGAALVANRMPAPDTDLGRLTALALVLAGPVTTIGAIVARVYWPRIVGVVVAGGLAAAAFVGRALLV